MVSGIYAITDSRLLPGNRLYDGVLQALRGGIRWIQYRDKTAEPTELTDRAEQLARLCHEFGARIIINDSIEAALLAGADGVHLGTGDDSITAARARLGPDAVIGATCHDRLSLAHQAQIDGASYVAFGRFYPSATKPSASPADINLLGEARAQIHCPIVAIGGVTQDNMAPLITRGAHAIALSNELFSAPDIECKAKSLIAAFKQMEASHLS